MLCFLIIIPDVFCEPLFLFFIFIPCCRGDDAPSSLRFVASLFSFFNSSLLLIFSLRFRFPLHLLGLSSRNPLVLPVVFPSFSVTSFFLCLNSFRSYLVFHTDNVSRPFNPAIHYFANYTNLSQFKCHLLYLSFSYFSHPLQRLFS